LRKLAVLGVVIASLAFAASALAGSKTIAQTGGVIGDKAASVKLRIKVKNGVATKVSGFQASNVFTRCDGEVVRFKYNALDPLPVVDNEFKIKLVGGGGAVMRIQGKVKNGGRATKGSLRTNTFSSAGHTCRSPKQRFKTSS
jgi:hypothetical protein